MLELVKIVGGISWVIGLVYLFVDPTLGLPALIVALICTVYSVSKTRQLRHEEMLQASGNRQPANIHSASDRLAELDRLREAGGISEEEYESKRKQIIDSL